MNFLLQQNEAVLRIASMDEVALGERTLIGVANTPLDCIASRGYESSSERFKARGREAFFRVAIVQEQET